MLEPGTEQSLSLLGSRPREPNAEHWLYSKMYQVQEPLLYANLSIQLLGGIVLALSFHNIIHPFFVFTWLASLTATIIVYAAILIRRRITQRIQKNTQQHRWLIQQRYAAWLFGIIWGSASLGILTITDQAYQLLLASSLLISTVIAPFFLYPVRWAYFGFGCCLLLPLLGVSLLTYDYKLIGFTVLTAIMLMTLTNNANLLRKRTIKSIRSYNQNKLLNSSLQQEHAKLLTARDTITESQRFYKMIAEHGGDVITLQDKYGRYLYVSDGIERLTGYKPGEVIWNGVADFIHPVDLVFLIKNYWPRVLNSEKVPATRYRLKHKEGYFIWLEVTARNIIMDDKQVRVVAVGSDITEKIKMERRLARERGQATELLNSLGDAVLSINHQYCIQYLNPAAKQLLDIDHQNYVGEKASSIIRLAPPIETLLNTEAISESVQRQEVSLHLLDRTIPVEITNSPWGDEFGEDGFILTLRDISETQALKNKLIKQANHDDLTESLGRRAFNEKIDHLIAHIQTEQQHVLAIIDLDNFKNVNDNYGHPAGDEVLVKVSQTMRQYLRKNDFIARLGGDEFAVVFRDCNAHAGQALCERLRRAILNLTFDWENRTATEAPDPQTLPAVSVSIGLGILNHKTLSRTEIMKEVDAACYTAKNTGKNRTHSIAQAQMNRAHRPISKRLH